MEVKQLTNPVGLFCEMLAFPRPAERGAVSCRAAGRDIEMSHSQDAKAGPSGWR